MKTKNVVMAVLVVIILGIAMFVLWPRPVAAPVPTANTPINTVSYACDAGKAITAAFYEGATVPPAGPDLPPTPGGSVHLVLSDGRTMTLPQTISADGIRYANAGESFIFWSKGDGAFVMEGNVQTYASCVQAALK